MIWSTSHPSNDASPLRPPPRVATKPNDDPAEGRRTARVAMKFRSRPVAPDGVLNSRSPTNGLASAALSPPKPSPSNATLRFARRMGASRFVISVGQPLRPWSGGRNASLASIWPPATTATASVSLGRQSRSMPPIPSVPRVGSSTPAMRPNAPTLGMIPSSISSRRMRSSTSRSRLWGSANLPLSGRSTNEGGVASMINALGRFRSRSGSAPAASVEAADPSGRPKHQLATTPAMPMVQHDFIWKVTRRAPSRTDIPPRRRLQRRITIGPAF